MKRVSGYQTTDGTIFTSAQKAEARAHQASLNVIAGLTIVGNRIDNDDCLYSDDFGCNAILTGEQFAKFVLLNAEDIRKALDGKVIEPPSQVEAVVNRDAEPLPSFIVQ